MQRLLKEEREIREDYAVEGEEITPKYGELLDDLILMRWIELIDPMKYLNENPDVLQRFSKLWERESKTYQKFLYRGTDYDPFKCLKIGDIIDYTNRYTSWTTDLGVAINFTEQQQPIMFQISGNLKALHVIFNSSEKEFILSPCKLRVNSILIEEEINIFQLEFESI